MPSQREIVAALYGAWRLMRFDAGGMNWFDLTLGYVPLVVAYNWTSVPQIVLQTTVALISELGLLPQGLAGILLFVAVVYILVYEWFVVRTALQTTPGTAIGIVILFEVLGVTLNLTAFG